MVEGEEVMISYLPVSHIVAQVLQHHCVIVIVTITYNITATLITLTVTVTFTILLTLVNFLR